MISNRLVCLGTLWSLMSLVVWHGPLAMADDEAGIADAAVVRFSFEEVKGPAIDSATQGTVKDVGEFTNGPARVRSPFPGQGGKSAVILDGPRRQFLQVADGADVDLGQGVTASCWYLHLGSLDDGAFQGLFAKRHEGGSTTFGINYTPKGDVLQVYLNDGSGFRTVHYSFKETIGSRKAVFLTTTYEIGDAPGADADSDVDDVRVRLFSNGKMQSPRPIPGLLLDGQDAWLTNLNLPGLLNNVPVTVGSSTAAIEFTAGIIDEFSLFPRALTEPEVQRLFTETAGPAAQWPQFTEQVAAPVPPPQLVSLSQTGVQRGTTTTLTIRGQHLLPQPRIDVPIPGAQVEIAAQSTSTELQVTLTIPGDIPATHIPLQVLTPSGISNPLPLAIDGLPHILAGQSSLEQPTKLPVAVSGQLSGAAQPRVYFEGAAGEQIVADIEARRLGSGFSPVLELKTERGTPRTIAWGHVERGGDARLVAVLPHSGRYFVELHDLSYNAAGINPYRLKIGQLRLTDAVLGGVTVGTQAERFIGGFGLEADLKTMIDLRSRPFNGLLGWPLQGATDCVAPAPLLVAAEGPEYAESVSGDGSTAAIDATFSQQTAPVGFTGVLKQRRERDRILFQVTPGQKLIFTVSGELVGSPIDPVLNLVDPVSRDGLKVAQNPGSRTGTLEFTVFPQMMRLQADVHDLRGRGGDDMRYRLTVVPANQPEFDLSLSADRIQLPSDGAALFQVNVNRRGYTGAIDLTASGSTSFDQQPDSGLPLQVIPSTLPAHVTKSWVIVRRDNVDETAGPSAFHLVGTAADGAIKRRQVAETPANASLHLIPQAQRLVSVGVTPKLNSQLVVGELPAAIFKGVDFSIPVTLQQTEGAAVRYARLTLLTTETPRLNNANDPNQGQKPRVESGLHQIIEVGQTDGRIEISVPIDIAEPDLDCVIKAELIEHPFAGTVIGTMYSSPFRRPVLAAVDIKPATDTLQLKVGQTAKFTGQLLRRPGFAGEVELQILNLPAGTTVSPTVLAGDVSEFEVSITPPNTTTAMDVPNVILRVLSRGSDKPIVADVPLHVRLSP